MAKLTRRTFLGRSAAVVGSVLAAPYFVPARALGRDGAVAPSERITMAAIGVGGRNTYDMTAFMGEKVVQMIGVCDVQKSRRDAAEKIVNEHYGNQDCKAYRDLRELLARPDLDAVNIGTGENWHAPASIMAARAGKDIYCEKPGTHTIAEGRVLSDTVRRLARVYQGGTQRRSLSHFRFALDLARSGKLGQLKTVRAEAPPSVPGYLTFPAQPQPDREIVDWDIFLGANPWRPYNQNWLHAWRGDFDFQGGGIKEWGAHTVCLCQLANDADATSPVEYEHTGKDMTCRYANGVELVLTSGLGQVGVRFEGTEGWVHVNDDGVKGTHPESLLGNQKFGSGYPANDHIQNFLTCIRTRGTPRSHVEAIQRSMTACHCADLSMFLGRPLKWDPVKEEFIGDDEANRMRSRAFRAPWRV
jgi:hypothetical protein